MTLKLALSVGKTCALTNATVNHGGIKLLLARVLEKTISTVVHATRKLPYHFQEYTIIVITQPPLRATLRGTDYAKRVAKWGTILGLPTLSICPVHMSRGEFSWV